MSRLAGKKLSRGKRSSLLNPTVSVEEKRFLAVEPCGVAETYGDPVAVVDDAAAVVAAAAVPDGGCVKG